MLSCRAGEYGLSDILLKNLVHLASHILTVVSILAPAHIRYRTSSIHESSFAVPVTSLSGYIYDFEALSLCITDSIETLSMRRGGNIKN